MEHYIFRLNSFKNHENKFKVKCEDLALAGFYYSGVSDEVICFKCGLRLFQWKIGDDPTAEHDKYSLKCFDTGCCKESVQICLTVTNFSNKLDQIRFIRRIMQNDNYRELFHQESREALNDTFDKVMKKMEGRILNYVKHNHIVGLCLLANCNNHNKSYPLPCNCEWLTQRINLIIYHLGNYYHYMMKERDDYYDI